MSKWLSRIGIMLVYMILLTLCVRADYWRVVGLGIGLLTGIAYLLLVRRVAAIPLVATRERPISRTLRLILIVAAMLLYVRSWDGQVVTYVAPDSGTHHSRFADSAEKYVNSGYYQSETWPWRLMVAAWTVPPIAILATILIFLFSRGSFAMSFWFRAYFIATLFASVMPLWMWGDAGAKQNAAALLGLLAVSTWKRKLQQSLPPVSGTRGASAASAPVAPRIPER